MKTTGPGKVESFRATKEPHFSLYNFDIDGCDLKSEHKTFLRDKIGIFRSDTRIVLRGLTSRTGSEAHNNRLAKRRIESVKEYIRSLAIPECCQHDKSKSRFLFLTDPVGEIHNFHSSPEDQHYRAVWVRLLENNAPMPGPGPTPRPVPPKKKHPQKIPQTNLFQIRAVSGHSITIGPSRAGTFMITVVFEVAAIHQGKREETCKYIYTGNGLVTPGGISISGISGGWSNTFSTNYWVKVDELGPSIYRADLEIADWGSTKKKGSSPRLYGTLTVKKNGSNLRFEAYRIDLGTSFKPSLFTTSGHFIKKD